MYYLVGIRGTGMSALANALYSLGYGVMGSDKAEVFFTEKELKDKSIEILNFSKENIINNKDCIFIIGYSYNEKNNDEVKEILRLNLPYHYYGEFINKFFDGIKIGVSGTHGKTTICKLLSSFIPSSSYIIGDGSGKGVKNSQYFIFESCEYKSHFLKYDYEYLIINNIEYDHPDYYKSESEYISAFKKVSKRSKNIIINGDDKNSKYIKHKHKYTYGFKKHNYLRIKIINQSVDGYKASFTIDKETYVYNLKVYGKHMLYNMASCVLLLHILGIDLRVINSKNISLPKLRMNERTYNSNIIIDDYAHHPSEIKALLSSIRQKYPFHEIVTIFQPHTYSRTLSLKKDFKNVFKDVKESYLVKTFISREQYDKQKEREVKKVFKRSKYFTNDDFMRLKKYKHHVILFIGAGNFHSFYFNW